MIDENNQQLSIGEKIRNLRKREGLSQLELEVEINASPGSISRMESGKVNPTKTTILQLGKILKLNEKELADLMEFRHLSPTQEEIAAAIEECKEFLDQPDTLCYLADDNGVVHSISNGFIQLLNLTPEQVELIKGRNFIMMALDPSLGISKYLDFDKNKNVMLLSLARIMKESSIASSQLAEIRKLFPQIDEVLGSMNTVTTNLLLDTRNNYVHFIINGNKQKYRFSKENLKMNIRFELVQYFDPVSY